MWESFKSNEAESVHYTHFNENHTYDDEEELNKDFERLELIRTDVLKALEEARQDKVIGKSLEAHVDLHVSEEDRELLDKTFGENVKQWLIVSSVSYTDEKLKEYEVLEARVMKAEGTVCPRCWNVTSEADEDGLCPRCHNVMK